MRFGPWQCRLKDLFEFAQELGTRESSLGDLGRAAGRDVQHPEWHFQNPRCLDVFQAAVRYRPAAFHERGMHPYCPTVPWMPGIADLTEISNMGAVLLSCITKNAITKARTTFCSSLPRPRLSPAADVASVVENASAAYSGTTAAPHEYFDQSASSEKLACSVGESPTGERVRTP